MELLIGKAGSTLDSHKRSKARCYKTILWQARTDGLAWFNDKIRPLAVFPLWVQPVLGFWQGNFREYRKKLCDENPETYHALPGHAELLKTFEKIFAPQGVLVSFKGLQYAVSFPPPPQRTALELRGPRVRFEDKTYQTWRVFGLQTMQLHSRHAGFLSLQKHDFKPEDTLVVFKPVHNLRHHLGEDVLDGTESVSAGVAGVMSGLPTAKRRKVDANPELFTRLVDTEVMRDRLEALRCRKPL